MLFIAVFLLLPLASSMEQSDCHLCPPPTSCASVKDHFRAPLIICRCDGTKMMDSSRLPSMARFDRELAVMSSLLNINVQFIPQTIEETDTNSHNTTSDMIIDITKCYDGPTDNETMFRKAQHFIQKFMESKGILRGPISTDALTNSSVPNSTASSTTTSSTSVSSSSTFSFASSSTFSTDSSVFAISPDSTSSSTSSPNSSVFAISPESLYTLLIIIVVLVFLLIISIIISCVVLCRKSKKNRYSVKPTECYLREYTADESSRFLNDHF